jgi:hypothetical protein
MYGYQHELKVVQHACNHDALNNHQEAIAAFLLLLNWMKNSTKAFYKTCTENNYGTIFGTSQRQKCATCHSFLHTSKIPPLPGATWGMHILVVWNKAAWGADITSSPSWLEKTIQAVNFNPPY